MTNGKNILAIATGVGIAVGLGYFIFRKKEETTQSGQVKIAGIPLVVLGADVDYIRVLLPITNISQTAQDVRIIARSYIEPDTIYYDMTENYPIGDTIVFGIGEIGQEILRNDFLLIELFVDGIKNDHIIFYPDNLLEHNI